MTMFSPIRLRAAALLAGFALALSGCFMTPGKFTSELAITGPDSFTFSYEGEIFFLGLSKLAQMDSAVAEFTPSGCYNDETFEERECTAEEIASQRAEWDAGAAERAAKAKKDAEMMKAVMGGIEVHRRMPISLTFDHRACTGGEAARFLAALLDDLAQPT